MSSLRGSDEATSEWFRAFAAHFPGVPPSTPICPRLFDAAIGLAPANGSFRFQAFRGAVTLPPAEQQYNSDWTPLWARLSSAGLATSPPHQIQTCRIYAYLAGEFRSWRSVAVETPT